MAIPPRRARDTLYPATSASEDRRVVALKQGTAPAGVRKLDNLIGRADTIVVATIWHSPGSAAYSIGADLADYDREARRAAALIRQPAHEFPRPIALRDGRFNIVDAAPGSLSLAIDAVGILGMVLLSHPVQLLLTTDAILGKLRTVRAWVGRRSDPLSGISARDALQLLREHGGLVDMPSLGRPDHELALTNARETTPRDSIRYVELEVFADESRTVVRGHRITHVRTRSDGTVDVLVVE